VIGQIVTQPDRPDAGWGNKHPQFTQFVGRACLSVSRKIRGRFDDGIFGGLINPIGQVGLASGPLEQCLDPAIIHRRFVAIKCIPGHAHHLAGFGHVAQLFGKVQQADFVFDDLLGSARSLEPMAFGASLFNIVVSSFCGWCAPPSKR